MKVKVPLRDSTMKASRHWLEIDAEGDIYRVSLRNNKGVVGGSDAVPLKKMFLEHLAEVGPGVILKDGPLRFYRTDEDVRISFTEDEEGLTGFDRLDTDEFIDAIHKVLGGDETESHRKSAPANISSTHKKRAVPRTKHPKKASKRS